MIDEGCCLFLAAYACSLGASHCGERLTAEFLPVGLRIHRSKNDSVLPLVTRSLVTVTLLLITM